MATFNRVPNQSGSALAAGAARYGRQDFVAEAFIDFSATGNTNTTADIFNSISVPAGYAITGTGVEVIIADTAGNSGTIQLKLGSTAQGSAVAPSSAGYLATVGTYTPVVPSGSQAYLNVVIGTGAINAVVRVYALLQDTRGKNTAPVATGTITNNLGLVTTVYRAMTAAEQTALIA